MSELFAETVFALGVLTGLGAAALAMWRERRDARAALLEARRQVELSERLIGDYLRRLLQQEMPDAALVSTTVDKARPAISLEDVWARPPRLRKVQ